MTQRAKLYITNSKGRRTHLLILKTTQISRPSELDRLADQVNALNKGLRNGSAGPIVGIVIPNGMDYQVIRL